MIHDIILVIVQTAHSLKLPASAHALIPHLIALLLTILMVVSPIIILIMVVRIPVRCCSLKQFP